MAKRGKRYLEAAAKINQDELYDVEQAVKLLKDISFAKFDETVDLAVRLGVDPRHADQMIRGAVTLPNGTGKEVRVVVFAKGDKAKEAEQAGADFVGDDDLIAKIEGGWHDFDVAIATPDMMAAVGRLGRILGPRGLMPNPKSGTITFEIEQAVRDVKAGKIEYRTDKAGVVHVPIGKVSFDAQSLEENLRAVLDALIKAKPASAKGQYVRSIAISTTMGPSIRIHPARVTGVA